MLGEGPTYGINVLMEALIHQARSAVLTLVKQTQNFTWVYITVVIIVIC